MSSEQIPTDPADVLEHDCSLHFDKKNASEFSFTPVFWLSVDRVFRQFLRSLDEQQHARARDRESFLARTKPKRAKVDDGVSIDEENEKSTAITYKRKNGSIKVPAVNMLGDVAKDLMGMLPSIQSNMNDKSPVLVYRFITVPLEDVMDQ